MNNLYNLNLIRKNFRFVKSFFTFFDYPSLHLKRNLLPEILNKAGHKSLLRNLHNVHEGKRCFVMGNGPSLANMDIELLKNEIIIGSNGVYKLFENYSFRPKYLVFQDLHTIAGKADEINKIKGIKKIVALQASHLVNRDKDTLFFYLGDHLGWNVISNNNKISKESLPQFSNNFSSCASNLGNITHTAIQLAYFLGCNPIYIIGCDHSHGDLCKYFAPGHVMITKENKHIIEKHHFTKGYYKIGDYIGVPLYEFETLGYKTAYTFLIKNKRQLINTGISKNLEFIPYKSLESIFNK